MTKKFLSIKFVRWRNCAVTLRMLGLACCITMSSSTNFPTTFFLYFVTLGLVLNSLPGVNGQGPTWRDIDNLQNQIDQCQSDANYAIDLASSNYNSIQQLQALVDSRWDYTLDQLDRIFSELGYLDSSLNNAWGAIGDLRNRVSGLEVTMVEVEELILKLYENNEIWLNNFKVIKNILTNGFKFKGTINYGAPLVLGTFVPRTKVVTAIVVQAPARTTAAVTSKKPPPTVLQGKTGTQDVVTPRSKKVKTTKKPAKARN